MLRVGALAAAVVLFGACSFFKKPLSKRWQPPEPVGCSSSREAPVADTIVAIGFAAIGTAVVIDGRGCRGDLCGLDVFVWLPSFIIGGTYGIAAATGFGKATKCRDAETRLANMSVDDTRAGRIRLAPERLARATGLKVRVATRDHLVLLGGTGSSACIKLAWTASVRTEASDLRALGIRQVTCRAGTNVIWSGELSALPADVDATSCGPDVTAAVTERDARRRTQLIDALPGACRLAGDAPVWHGEAVSAADQGDCDRARTIMKKIRWASERYYTERILTNPRLSGCRSE